MFVDSPLLNENNKKWILIFLKIQITDPFKSNSNKVSFISTFSILKPVIVEFKTGFLGAADFSTIQFSS